VIAAALTILLSSFLLFLVQPLLAKQMLPWFGGSAGVWTICVTFFQVVLVLGYTYAHLLTRRPVAARAPRVHIALLALSCLTLPIIPAIFWKSAHGLAPAFQILGLLATTVGLPYFLLASTSPLLQAWLLDSAGSPLQSASIYRLFGWSNFGSLAGLLSYPFAIEPYFPLRTQAWGWSAAYALFVACAVAYAWSRRRLPARAEAGGGVPSPTPPTMRAYLFWMGCAALGSLLLLAGTNQITQNVAAIPLLWVVPLSLYLLSFMLCFEGRAGRGWYERRFWLTPALLATGAMAWALFADQANLSARIAVPLFAVGIFLGCMTCHGELARSKPDPAYLTRFYLSIAVGGALGGMFVGLIAPRIFKGYWEAPLALLALAALGVYCASAEDRRTPATSWMTNVVVAVLSAALILLLLGGLPPSSLDPYTLPWSKIVQGDARWGCAALLLLGAVLLQRNHLWRALALMMLVCVVRFDWGYYRTLSANTEFAERNFYGTLRVNESGHGADRLRRLIHGVILHGSQLIDGSQRDTPTTYFGHSSGIGRTLESEQRAADGPLRIGSVGLGAGTLAVYPRAGDLFQVYELNPAVMEIAEHQFTFLKDCKGQVQLVLGDARLSLENALARGEFAAPEQRFDVLSLDAFSGDAIPTHLLTREAFALYQQVIKPDGIIAFHLSNRYLDLPPVVGQIAHEAGFGAVLVADRPPVSGLNSPSDWVLVTRDVGFLQRPEIASHGAAIKRRVGRAWTDQYTNLFQILK